MPRKDILTFNNINVCRWKTWGAGRRRRVVLEAAKAGRFVIFQIISTLIFI